VGASLLNYSSVEIVGKNNNLVSTHEPAKKKGQNSMLIEVAVIAKPSVVAAQGGAQSSLIVPVTAVVAPSVEAALLIVGANNADAIDAAKPDFLEVKVRQM
jgi:hypothetical protein